MRFVLLTTLLTLLLSTNYAQRTVSFAPPNAALITVGVPNAQGIVRIIGDAGAAPPNAQIAVRNLYTGETVYARTGVTGSFSTALYGPDTTPFWISPASEIPQALINAEPASLPGGPGTIIYGSAPAAPERPPQITALSIDGRLADWDAYPSSELNNSTLFGRVNTRSLYLAVRDSRINPETTATVRFFLRTGESEYQLNASTSQTRAVRLTQTRFSRLDFGTLAANVRFDEGILELRTESAIFPDRTAPLIITGVALIDAENRPIDPALSVEFEIPETDEIDGDTRAKRLPDDTRRFFVAGRIGANRWSAVGRFDTLAIAPGDPFVVEMDVDIFAPSLSLDVTDLSFYGGLRLQPVSQAGRYTNNGWSNLQTVSGLAIDNLRTDITLTETGVNWEQVRRYRDGLSFTLRFEAVIPDDLPPDLYVPLFDGSLTENGDGIHRPWPESALFGGGDGRVWETRLPIVLNVGEVSETHLPLALLIDHPSDGSRGIRASEDSDRFALSNRVRFNSPSYVLPPGAYPIEPYVLNAMPNSYTQTSAPLVTWPPASGELDVVVTRPDGTLDSIGTVPLAQNRLSTETIDERARFGEQSPLDVLRLTTLDPRLTDYAFDAYGDYTVTLTAQFNDVWGNTYTGGGTYQVTIAQPLDLQPGVLPGTPFEVGDSVYAGAHIAPQIDADFTVTLTVYPLRGEPITRTIIGSNAHGRFAPAEHFTIEQAGEYVLDYEARAVDAQGRLWAGSLRSAGVIANPESTLVLHGVRGLDGAFDDSTAQPAWFSTRVYPDRSGTTPPRLNYPYFRGDVATYYDLRESGMLPVLQAQSPDGRYADWLKAQGLDAASIDRAANLGALPLTAPTSTAVYTYLNAVRAGVSVRQFINSGQDGVLPLRWDAEDPLNGQIGAGQNGDRPKDFVFLFGGAVIRDPDGGLIDSAIYGAHGVVVETSTAYGARVYPPYRGQMGGADGGAVLTVRGIEYDGFFHPTSVKAGDVLNLGDRIEIAGQVAPTLQHTVRVLITAPSGTEYRIEGTSSSIGYFYAPLSAITANEIGVWRVKIETLPAEATSAGQITESLPVGGVIGAQSNEFNVYVQAPDTPPLRWNRGGNVEDRIPAATPLNFTINIPQGWTDFRVYRTLTIPGYIIDEGTLPSLSPAAYQYSPPNLALEFPNIELSGRATGANISDVVTITFAVEGTAPDGTRQLATRTLTVMQEMLISIEIEAEEAP